MTPEKKLQIIKLHLAEIIGNEELEKKILSGETLKVYWGTCPTGTIHLGYLVPLIKIAHLVLCECEVTILFADLHAYLDSIKTSWELLELRTKYYEELIKQTLLCLGVDISKIRFIKGSEFQLETKYTMDVYKLLSKVTIQDTIEGIKDVINQPTNPVLSGLIYPILQMLDEVYLNINCELGGIDQYNIFMMGCKNLHKIGYNSNIYLMNNVVPNLKIKNFQDLSIVGNKMSSSGHSDTKINLTDKPNTIYEKIENIPIIQSNEMNVLFCYLRDIIFPIILLQNAVGYSKPNHKHIRFNIMVDGFYGDCLGLESFCNFDEFYKAYCSDIIGPRDVKKSVSLWIINFLSPVRKYFSSDEMKELIIKACLE